MKKYVAVFLFVLFLLSATYHELSDIKIVQASKLNTELYQKKINVTGEFENSDKTSIIYSIPLFIKDLFIKENSYVNKGQALFSIDKNKMADIITNGLSEDIITAFKDIDLTGVNSRINGFSADNILNLPDIVYSPENGIVKSVSIFNGAISLPGRPLLEIEHIDNIKARFTLSQLDYGKINIGDRVVIKPIAFENIFYDGIVTDENAVIKKQSSLTGDKTVVDVFANINTPDKLVSSGLQLNGEILCGEEQEIKTLQHEFVYQDMNNQFVYTFEKGVASKKYIETGIETNDYVQILTEFDKDTIFLSGDINNGDRVIIAK
ncbi:MAG: HlyD family efflux transporter periplasmic adaptor subunit [Oscillospiraceae bacterium]|nr:HlyD family efflux transporter periplasmic adaptor subunit [Oscillospiraceae bacterium]